MATATPDTALRKRQQIAKANRTMFLWVAAASLLIGSAIVVSLFLLQKLTFNEKVLNKKQDTVSTLTKNNQAVEGLKNAARVRNTDQNLLSIRSNDTSSALQVILDALPSKSNPAGLGASLQNILIPGEGITIESLTIDSADGSGEGDAPVATGANTIGFSFRVTAPADKIDSLRDLLLRLERSIRPISVQSIDFEIETGGVAMQVKAVSYFEPGKTVDLREEMVKP
jgi:hypothetical protein